MKKWLLFTLILVAAPLMARFGQEYHWLPSELADEADLEEWRRNRWAQFVHAFLSLPAEAQGRRKRAIVARHAYLEELKYQCPAFRGKCGEFEEATWEALEKEWWEDHESRSRLGEENSP